MTQIERVIEECRIIGEVGYPKRDLVASIVWFFDNLNNEVTEIAAPDVLKEFEFVFDVD